MNIDRDNLIEEIKNSIKKVRDKRIHFESENIPEIEKRRRNLFNDLEELENKHRKERDAYKRHLLEKRIYSAKENLEFGYYRRDIDKAIRSLSEQENALKKRLNFIISGLPSHNPKFINDRNNKGNNFNIEVNKDVESIDYYCQSCNCHINFCRCN